jgi:hypothetical protein
MAGLLPMSTAADLYFLAILGWIEVGAYVALLVAFGLGLPPDPLDLGDVVAE